MKPISYSCILALSLVLPTLASAVPMITTTTSTDLSKISFKTTGTLDIELDLAVNASAVATIDSQDLELYRDPADNAWHAEDVEYVDLSFNFTANGDGHLTVSTVSSMSQIAAPWVDVGQPIGQDPHFWEISIYNISSGQNAHDSDISAPLEFRYQESWIFGLPAVLFNDGDVGRFDIGIWAYCGWWWDEKPDASIAPVPEPATMILFGIGISGVCMIKRRK